MIRIWISSISSSYTTLSLNEEEWSKKLSYGRANQYLFTRYLLRKLLSEVLNRTIYDVPLFAPPGMPPKLLNNLGYVSISHTKTKVLLAFSTDNIGIDIEEKNRIFKTERILNKFSKSNKKILKKNKSKFLKEDVLRQWVIKESAVKLFEESIFKNISKLKYNGIDSIVLNSENKKRAFISSFDFQKYHISIATFKPYKRQIIICNHI